MWASKRHGRPIAIWLCGAGSLAILSSLLLGCGGHHGATTPVGDAESSGGGTGSTASGSRDATTSGSSGGVSSSGGGSGASGSGTTGGATSSGTTGDASPSSGTSSDAAVGGPFAPKPSPGCFGTSPWTGPLGTWVAQPPGCDGAAQDGGAPFDNSVCQPIPPGTTPPANPMSGDPEYRGWWTLVPTGYVTDPTAPYKIIFNANGCPGFPYVAGRNGYPYQSVDDGQAIQVGLDLDTFSERSGCYDGRNPSSNDLVFLPWLMAHIEDELCVDMNHEFFSTYADDASLMEQFECAFPDKLRGSVSVSGFEPGAPGSPGSLPACVSKPSAAFYVHDYNDTETSYSAILPGCSRALQQNGCSSTKCDPLDATLTSPYAVPKGVTLPPSAVCRQFNGCPDDYPVVFCVTYNQGHFDDQSWGVVPLFWDWMANRLR
jgi:hypothetical protein